MNRTKKRVLPNSWCPLYTLLLLWELSTRLLPSYCSDPIHNFKPWWWEMEDNVNLRLQPLQRSDLISLFLTIVCFHSLASRKRTVLYLVWAFDSFGHFALKEKKDKGLKLHSSRSHFISLSVYSPVLPLRVIYQWAHFWHYRTRQLDHLFYCQTSQ